VRLSVDAGLFGLKPRLLRRFRTGWLTGGLHVLILWIALEAESAEVWPYALAAMSAVSFVAWAANYRRYRQVHDVPTSRVASAAQGYVELFGRAALMRDTPVTAPFSGVPCCWFSYCVEVKTSDDKWKHEDSGESDAHFLLVDDSGECVVAPQGAEILFPQRTCWTEGSRRYTEELLLPQGHLYALGDFRTTGGAHLQADENKDVSHLLADWKQDQAKLLQRFDADASGSLDLREWEQARLEARRHVRERHAGRSGEGVNLICKPADGRVFILAAELPGRIGRRFALWSWGHLIFFFGAGIASWLLFGSSGPAP
jgi:hypothetical protein